MTKCNYLFVTKEASLALTQLLTSTFTQFNQTKIESQIIIFGFRAAAAAARNRTPLICPGY